MITSSIERDEQALFFIDGLGGTGKTYLYRVVLAFIRSAGYIALATATSGIAATILAGGRTTHSRFKIPLNVDASSICSVSKQSELADLLKICKAIIWDEASMANRYAFEALDRTLRDIMEVDLPFGGKVMIFGGDFRQVLSVVTKGTMHQLVNASLNKSPLWKSVCVLQLTQNMRSLSDKSFSDFILRVGDGV